MPVVSTKNFPPSTPSRREDLWNASRRLPEGRGGIEYAVGAYLRRLQASEALTPVGERTLECQ